jgi:aspartyl protease family protein
MVAIKKNLSGFILASSLVVISFAQSLLAQPECFLQGANGQNIDLSNLCGGGRPARNTTSPNNSGVYSIPILRREMGIPVIQVIFNGKQKFEMLFDTGASGIAITESMANTIGVHKEQTGVASTAAGDVIYHVGRVGSVQVGNLIKKNLEVGIPQNMNGLGLLGQDFFGNYDITIKEKIIELRPRR